MPDQDKVVPDAEDYEAAKSDPSYASATDAEKYRLAQAAKIIRMDAEVREAMTRYFDNRVSQGWTREEVRAHLEKMIRDEHAEESRKQFTVILGDKSD
jgi:hypothetical protein